MVGVALETGVRHPAHIITSLEPFREREGVLRVALSAQRQGLDADDELLGGKGVQGGAEVAEDLDAGADDEGDGAKRLPELEAVVAVRRLRHLREAAVVPLELSAIDDNAADGGAVAADPLCRRVDYDVGAVVDGTDEVAACAEGVVDLWGVSLCVLPTTETEGRGKGGTYNDGDALLVRNLGNSLEVRDVVLWVPDALDVDGLGLVVNGGGDILDTVAVDELGVDAEAGEEDLELVVGAAVQQRGGDDVVASVREGVDGDELGGLARGGGKGRDAALECGDALLKDIDCGLEEWEEIRSVCKLGTRCNMRFVEEVISTYVHDTAVNVTKLLEAKEPRAVSRVIEGETLHMLKSAVSPTVFAPALAERESLVARRRRGRFNEPWLRRWGRRASLWSGLAPGYKDTTIPTR